jgi:hypothetical protein
MGFDGAIIDRTDQKLVWFWTGFQVRKIEWLNLNGTEDYGQRTFPTNSVDKAIIATTIVLLLMVDTSLIHSLDMRIPLE